MPVTVPYTSIPNLVDSQNLAEHCKLWSGYVEMRKRTENALSEQAHETLGPAPTIDSELRLLQQSFRFAKNGAALHKLYFEELTPENTLIRMSPSLLLAIKKCCVLGNNTLSDQLMRAGLVSKNGWAILSADAHTAALNVITIDSQDEGVPLSSIPIIVLDCWEHAYWGNWGSDRGGYLREIMNHLRWDVINARYASVRKCVADQKAQTSQSKSAAPKPPPVVVVQT